MTSYNTIRWQSLESVAWTFHIAIDHLAIESGTMTERLSFCTRRLSLLQPKLLRLPGSLTQQLIQLIQLIDDLQAGCYEYDPSQGDRAIGNYYSSLNSALLDSLANE